MILSCWSVFCLGKCKIAQLNTAWIHYKVSKIIGRAHLTNGLKNCLQVYNTKLFLFVCFLHWLNTLTIDLILLHLAQNSSEYLYKNYCRPSSRKWVLWVHRMAEYQRGGRVMSECRAMGARQKGQHLDASWGLKKSDSHHVTEPGHSLAFPAQLWLRTAHHLPLHYYSQRLTSYY